MTALPKIPRHSDTLDSMRAISALAVFVSHVVQIYWFPLIGLGNAVHHAINLLSESAVIVFFLLSGYLITMSIWKNIQRTQRFNVTEYAVSRFVRIYPPLICAILVALAVFWVIRLAALPGVATPLRHPSDLYAARDFLTLSRGEISNALKMQSGLLQINGPLWSLYIEVKLYVAAGAATFLLKGGAPRAWRWLAGGAALVAIVAYYIRTQPDYILYGAWWLLGSAFFLCQLPHKNKSVLAAAALILGAVILRYTTSPLLVEALRVPAMLALSWMMFFRWDWHYPRLDSIAGFSYTLYLVHFPILIFGYSLFVALQTNAPPPLAGRLAASLAAMFLAFGTAWVIGLRAEDTGMFKRPIMASLAAASRKLGFG